MIYVIGEHLGHDPRHQTSRRLASLCGVTETELLSNVTWLNLFDSPPETVHRTVELIERVAAPGDAVLLLGRRVARAWGLERIGPLGIVSRNAGRGPAIAVVPHPSGLNRWWNDPGHRQRGAAVLSTLWFRHSR